MVAGLSADRQYLKSSLSFQRLQIGERDGVYAQYGTRGDVGREMIANKFLESKYDSLLMLDLDQDFPPDTLTRLRAHDKDMVSGHYMKRTTRFLQSIWQYTLDGEWPYLPYIYPDIPKTGLHRIASTGLGCALIKRGVIENVKEFLNARAFGSNPFEIGKIPEVSPISVNFGSDYRFFFYAQKLGYELWGDADLELPHAASIWLTRTPWEDMASTAEKRRDYLMKHVFENSIRSRAMITLNAVEARLKVLGDAYAEAEGRQKDVIGGQITEAQLWRDELTRLSPPAEYVRPWAEERPKDKPVFPTFRTQQEVDYAVEHRETAIDGSSPAEAAEKRKEVRQREAVDAANRINLANNILHPPASTNQGEILQIK